MVLNKTQKKEILKSIHSKLQKTKILEEELLNVLKINFKLKKQILKHKHKNENRIRNFN